MLPTTSFARALKIERRQVHEFDIMSNVGQSRLEYFRRRARWCGLATLVLPLTCIVGCGDGRPARFPVSGTVTIDGAPVTHGSINIW
jgi:hypothetical protein